MGSRFNDMILRFFRDDIGGIRITNEAGELLYEDERSAFVSVERTNWSFACPAPREGQRAEMWDLLCRDSGQTYMVISSTLREGDEVLQIHVLVDTSVYTGLYHDITDYTQKLQKEKDRDGLTGLYNKGKFMVLKQSLFKGKDAVAVFNMDVNNLKTMNDRYGHEAGDKLLIKAAESMRRIEARNVIPFRVGGDEFIVVALHLSEGEAEDLRRRWEAELEALNRNGDGILCVVACGMACGERGYDFDELLALADQRMYADKRAKKGEGEEIR